MQNIFLKIDKKILLIIVAVLVVVLIAGFFVYKYSKDVETTVENMENIDNQGTENPDETSILEPQKNLENMETEQESQPGLTICVDRCGDGICQPADTICEDSLNCICVETEVDCPSDCNN